MHQPPPHNAPPSPAALGPSPTTRRFRAALSTGLVLLTLSGAGCLTAAPAKDQVGPTFPDDKTQTVTLDIQVVRDETVLRLTNTTARKFGRSRIWLNRWFSREIEGLDVGQTLKFRLNEFKDTFGDNFRGGGFWATRNADRLVQAQLETADSLVGLVVVARSAD